MKTQYEVKNAIKFVEQDDYNEGCLPETGRTSHVECEFKANDVDGLLNQLNNFTGNNDVENVLLNSCEEDGRIDIQVMENGEGYPASQKELAQWKEGECKLYLACYSFNVEQVTRSTAKL